MPSYIESAVIDVNPTTLKPILFTTYKPIKKYILDITYEDSTTKQVELVERDKNRPYKVVFKKEGKLITAIGVPKVYEINEGNKFCDFVNNIMDSDDLLIELDCSSEYDCSKVRFYLKDIRDIIDIAKEGLEGEDPIEDIPLTRYPIYLNGFDCKTVILCKVDDEFNINLYSTITKIGEPLLRDQYSSFTVFTVDSEALVTVPLEQDTDYEDKFVVSVSEEMLDTEIKLIIKYYVNEIEHPVFDEFTIMPFKKTEEDNDNTRVLTRAVSTADMEYLGDGLKPALGIGLTPGYKQYRNSKNASTSVLDK